MPVRTRFSTVVAAMILPLEQVPRSRCPLQLYLPAFRVMLKPHCLHFIRPDRRRFGLRPWAAGRADSSALRLCTRAQSSSSMMRNSGAGWRIQSSGGFSTDERRPVSGCLR
ncbi:hypothetical protein D3C73_1346130 [compost metagenome]